MFHLSFEVSNSFKSLEFLSPIKVLILVIEIKWKYFKMDPQHKCLKATCQQNSIWNSPNQAIILWQDLLQLFYLPSLNWMDSQAAPPRIETLIAFWKGVKLLNCSNNIATDIDMCHLICIIQHTNRKEDPTLMRKNELAKYWQDLGIVKGKGL